MLIGRADDIGDLTRSLAGGVRPTAVLLLGEAGVGKTSVVEACVEQNRSRWTTITRGRTPGFGGAHVLVGLLSAMLESSATTPDPGPVIAAVESAIARGTLNKTVFPYPVAEAVLDFVEQVCAQGRSLVVLEDLHLAEPAVHSLVRILLRRLPDFSLDMLLTARTESRSGSLATTADAVLAAGGTTMELGPLTDAAVLELAARQLGRTPEPHLAVQLRRTGGNPLLVTEVLTGFDGSETLPTNVQEAVLGRLRRLSPPCLDVVRAAAVLGPRFTVAALSALTASSAFALLPLLSEAVDHRILVERGHRFAFQHDLTHETAYASLLPPVRLALHRDAASALQESGANADAVVRHLVLGAHPQDRAHTQRLLQAARDWRASSPSAAVTALEAACDLLTAPAELHPATLHLAELLVVTGRGPEAEPLLRGLLARRPEPRTTVRAQLALTRALLSQGRVPEITGLLSEMAVSDLDPAVRLRLTADTSLVAASARAVGIARELSQRVLELDAAEPDDLAAVPGLAARSILLSLQGSCHESLAQARECFRRAQASPEPRVDRYVPGFYLGWALMDTDCFAEAQQVLVDTTRNLDEHNVMWARPVLAGLGSMLHWAAGDWDEAVVEAESGLAFAEDSGVHLVSCALHVVLALVALEQDELDEAVQHLEAAASQRGSMLGHDWLPWLRAFLLHASGDDRGASDAAVEAWDELGVLGDQRVKRVAGPGLVRLALGGGHRDRARRVAEELADLAAVADTASARASALRARALVDADPATARLAVAQAQLAGRPLELAHAYEDLGALQLRAGLDAEHALGEARRLASDLGSMLTLRRLSSLDGGRLPRQRRRRQLADSGWGSLTPAEVRVSELVVGGLTNQQIANRLVVSRHTVESHLKHVYSKLAISSRTQLAVAVAQLSER